MTRCDYARCRARATVTEAGWGFCHTHLKAHRLLMAEDRITDAFHGLLLPSGSLAPLLAVLNNRSTAA